MNQPPAASIRLCVIYQGAGPVHWTGGAHDFGLQDKAEILHPGRIDPDGRVRFECAVEVKAGKQGVPVLLGPFTHGAPADRFLYLSWRNAGGDYALRFKLPLGAITPQQIATAQSTGEPLLAELIVATQRATRTGANIGGTRAIVWTNQEPGHASIIPEARANSCSRAL